MGFLTYRHKGGAPATTNTTPSSTSSSPTATASTSSPSPSPTRRKQQNKEKVKASRSDRPGRTNGIVDVNRKTELCRNWGAGFCSYGKECAFAHGALELRSQSLRELEQAGRIPSASKFRCFPCMTWVATGACPYSTRCVFVHDPRLRGHQGALLKEGGISTPAACAGSFITSQANVNKCASNGSSPGAHRVFFWPDIVEDRTSAHPLSIKSEGSSEEGDCAAPGSVIRDCEVTYELNGAMGHPDNPDHLSRSVYRAWYGLVEALMLSRGEDACLAADGKAAYHGRRLPVLLSLMKGSAMLPDSFPMPEISCRMETGDKASPCKECLCTKTSMWHHATVPQAVEEGKCRTPIVTAGTWADLLWSGGQENSCISCWGDRVGATKPAPTVAGTPKLRAIWPKGTSSHDVDHALLPLCA